MEIQFCPLSRADFPLLQRWLLEPHVDAWWHQPLDLAGLESKYGPRIDGLEPTHIFLILADTQPIGWIQWYRWTDYPEHATQLQTESTCAGIDLAIGEKASLGKGLGSQIIRHFINQFVFVHTEISGVVCDPEEGNVRSVRAFLKAGFVVRDIVKLKGETMNRKIVVLARNCHVSG